MLNKSAGNRHTLLLATGKLIGAMRCQMGDIKLLQSGKGNQTLFIAPDTQERLRGGNIVQTAHKHVGQNIKSINQIEMLEDHRTLRTPGAQPRTFKPCNVAAVPVNCSL